MSMTAARELTIADADRLVSAAEELFGTCLAHGREVTSGGRAIDEHQVPAEKRAFARSEVAPLAERIHRGDELVPESLIRKVAEIGLFAASIPERYQGTEMGYLVMVVSTEELSAASLGAAGSLATRPEILIKAL